MTNNNTNPWLGLKTYSEGQVLYGRSEEINTLSQDILFNRQTVVYGKSGIGKSSLLNAGVFPIIRRSNLFPVNVRLVHNDKQTTYFTQIKNQVENSICHLRKDIVGSDGRKQTLENICGSIEPLCEAVPNEDGETLWEYFHRHVFRNDLGEIIQPVIVFDQFEEIFTLCKEDSERRIFFDQLADLINDVPPSYIYESKDKQKDEIAGEDEIIDGSEDFVLIEDEEENNVQGFNYLQESNFHIVITLREDFLSYLERYTTNIPLLKHNRYCLRPLSDDQAGSIITDPVPGLISEEVAVEIICKITNSTPDEFKLGDGIAQLEVDSAILSLFLSELYKKKAPEDKTISIDLVRAIGDNIINSFYEETIAGISEKSAEYLERRLVTEDERRDSIFEDRALNRGVTKEELKYLKDERLIHEFPWNDDGMRIEFMHDILCPVIVERRKKRELKRIKEEEDRIKEEENARREKERQEMERRNQIEAQRLEDEKKAILQTKARNRKITAFLSIVALGLGALTVAVILMSNRNKRQKIELDTLNEEIRSFLPSLIEQRINDGDTYSAGMLLMRLFPDSQYVEGDPIRTSLFRKISGSNANIFMGHLQAVNVGTFSNDGRMVYTGSNDMTIKQWDTATGHLLASAYVGSPVMSLAVSPNGNKLAVATKDGSLRLFNIGDEKLSLSDSLIQKGTYARFITFSPNGSRLLACTSNNRLLICDASNVLKNDTMIIERNSITYISFDKKGQRMALAGTNHTIMIWDAINMKPIATLGGGQGHTDWVRSVEFSPDGNKLVSCSDDKTVRLWDLSSRSHKIIEQLPDWGTKAMFSTDGKRIITSCRDGYLRFIDVKSLCEIPELSIRHNGYLNQFDISPDGSLVVTCSTDPAAHTWNCGSTMETDFSTFVTGAVYGLALYDEGKRFAAVSNEGMLGTWDIKSKNNLFLVQDIGNGRLRRASSLCISPDGKIIAISTGSKVRLFDCKTGDEIEMNNDGGHRGWVRNICFSHDGKTIASVGADKRLVLWDVEKKKVRQRLTKENMLSWLPEPYSVDFSKDDRKIVTGAEDGSIRQWNVHNGELIGDPIYAHRKVVLTVHYNSNDSLILSSSGDQTACLSRINGTILRQFVGASGYMNDVIFGMTEDEIITASADKYIRIWCVANGEEVIRLGGHLGSVSRLGLSKDGTLVSADVLGKLILWTIPDLRTTVSKLYKKYNALGVYDNKQ